MLSLPCSYPIFTRRLRSAKRACGEIAELGAKISLRVVAAAALLDLWLNFPRATERLPAECCFGGSALCFRPGEAACKTAECLRMLVSFCLMESTSCALLQNMHRRQHACLLEVAD